MIQLTSLFSDYYHLSFSPIFRQDKNREETIISSLFPRHMRMNMFNNFVEVASFFK